MVVRGYYEMHISDEEVDICNEDELIEAAKILFDYNIQDRSVHSNNMTWEVIKENNVLNNQESDFDVIKFKRRCYELYQLDWLKTHGYSLQDAFDVLRKGYAMGCAAGDIDGGTECDNDFDLVEEYFEEQGFGGEIFACEVEFYDCEFNDAEFMEHLLPRDMFEQYVSSRIQINNMILCERES